MTAPVSGFIILSEVVPANLPSPEQIVVLCKNVGDKISGFSFADLSSGTLLAWFKYGPNVVMDEALTRAWVAEHLETKPEIGVKVPRDYMTFTSAHSFCDIGYIIIEYMAAPDCKSREYKRVAQAVVTLIRIEAPSSVPGPIDGGEVVHEFFVGWESDLKYDTSKELQDHVNRVSKHQSFNTSRLLMAHWP